MIISASHLTFLTRQASHEGPLLWRLFPRKGLIDPGACIDPGEVGTDGVDSTSSPLKEEARDDEDVSELLRTSLIENVRRLGKDRLPMDSRPCDIGGDNDPRESEYESRKAELLCCIDKEFSDISLVGNNPAAKLLNGGKAFWSEEGCNEGSFIN
ncbi:BA75_04069T0 [Komagataella pastoris]|uniref:BA75_04069T0 n=1 Tax=Komagataella pastoris TaxID=4922 RepID=A0A1B2JG68_PICPA|nr:BA75_04069T0 [Komagataella pastoris]